MIRHGNQLTLNNVDNNFYELISSSHIEIIFMGEDSSYKIAILIKEIESFKPINGTKT